MSSPIAQQWLTVQQASVYSGFSTESLRQRIHRGTLPHYRFGGRLLISREDFEALIRKVPTAHERKNKFTPERPEEVVRPQKP